MTGALDAEGATTRSLFDRGASKRVGRSGADRLAYVDAARAIAALLVVWQHGADKFVELAPEVTNRWMSDAASTVWFGHIGVIIFFCISGFVIPSSLTPGDPSSGRTFVIRRFFRLYPAYWLSIALALAVLWLPFGRTMSAADIARNLTMLPEALGAKPALGVYWTLAYEMAFYVFCLLAWRTGLLARRWLFPCMLVIALATGVVILAAAAATDRMDLRDVGLTAFFFAAMFFGAVWRRRLEGEVLCASERFALLAAMSGWLLLLPGACAFLVLGRGVSDPFYVAMPACFAISLGGFLLLTTVCRISWRPMAWIGVVSYSLYLFHPVMMAPVRAWLRTIVGERIDLAGAVGVYALISIAVAAVVYYLIERPAIAIGRHATRKPRVAG